MVDFTHGVKMKKFYLILITCFTLFSFIHAQDIIPRYSPNASVSQTIGYTNITITYCRPGVKLRKIWGDLVPFNKVWRTGANESTRIQFTTDVKINGNNIPAGTYSIYTIPTEKDWTVIINKALVWGLDYYPEQDLMRFKVTPQKGPFTERLMFTIPEITDSTCSVVMNWENLQISFDVSIDLAGQVYTRLKDEIAKAKSDDFQIYVIGADFAAEHGVFLDEAFKWINKALTISRNFNIYLAKANLLYKEGKYIDALKAVDMCRDAGRNDSDYSSHIAEIDYLEQKIKNKL